MCFICSEESAPFFFFFENFTQDLGRPFFRIATKVDVLQTKDLDMQQTKDLDMQTKCINKQINYLMCPELFCLLKLKYN